MSDIDDTINTLTNQVEELQFNLEQATEANQEWHELMNDNEVSEINELVEFARDYDFNAVKSFVNNFDLDEVEGFLNDHDLETLKSALRYNDIDELVKAFNKIDEYGDPEEMSDKLERAEEELAELQQQEDDRSEVLSEVVARVDYESEVQIRLDTQRMLNETQNRVDSLNLELQGKDVYIVDLKTKVARIENEYNALDQMYTTVTDALSLQQADYKQLAEYHERICRECDALRAAEPGVYTQAKEELLNKLLDLQARHIALQALYFGQVSGYDDVPSSKPEEN